MNLLRNIKAHKTPLLFINSTLVYYVCRMATSFVAFRFVNPEYMGIWATYTVYTVFATFLRLGVPNGMNRELPFYLGKGDKTRAYRYASTTLVYTLLTILAVFVAAILFFVLCDFDRYGSLGSCHLWASIVFFLTILVEPYTTYLSGTFRSNSSFDRLSKIQVWVAVIMLFTIPCICYWGFKGFLLREVIVTISNLCFLHFYRPIDKLRLFFDKACFKELLSVGFRIFILGYIVSFVDTLPRLFVVNFGTTYEMGLFSPVMLLVAIVLLIPTTIGNYLYPKFSSAYGEGKERIYFWHKTKQLLALSTTIGTLACALILLLIDYVVILFPSYTESVPYIKMLSVGTIFLGYKCCTVLCVTFKDWKWLSYNAIFYTIITITSIAVAKMLFADVLTVATFSLVVTFIVMYGFNLMMAYKLTHPKVLVENENSSNINLP